MAIEIRATGTEKTKIHLHGGIVYAIRLNALIRTSSVQWSTSRPGACLSRWSMAVVDVRRQRSSVRRSSRKLSISQIHANA